MKNIVFFPYVSHILALYVNKIIKQAFNLSIRFNEISRHYMRKFVIYFSRQTYFRHSSDNFPISATDPNNLVNRIRLIRRHWHPYGVDACFKASLVDAGIDQPVPKPESDVRFQLFFTPEFIRFSFACVFQSFAPDVVGIGCFQVMGLCLIIC